MAERSSLFSFVPRRLSAKIVTRRENRHHDTAIRDWATYDAGVQDVGRALYAAETMIHMEIAEGRDPAVALSRWLNDVRDKFAIPYAKGPSRVALCNCGEEKAENCPENCEMRANPDGATRG